MTRLITLAALTVATALPGLASAAVHYVRPGATGTGTGADWTNAYAKLPTSLVRGDTYYLAPGNYGSPILQDANKGSATIALVKASAANHGTNTGWNAAYGSGQAVFGWTQIYTDYYVFDGQRRNSDWQAGSLSQYGIRMGGLRLDDAMGHGADHATFRYVDFQGGGRDTGDGDDVIYGLAGNSYLSFQYCAMHDSDRTIFFMRGNWTYLTVDHSYLARNTSRPEMHGEMLSMTESTHVVWSNNVMEDIEGTAFIAGLNGGTESDWLVYGNVASHSAAYIADTGRKPGHNFGVAGFMFIADDATNRNVGNGIKVYNNTFANVQGTWSGVVIQRGSNNEVRNNVWYSSVRTNNSFGGSISNNWYYNTPVDSDTSTTKTVCSTGCNVFVNIAGKDFRLASATAGGLTLAAPFTVDGLGVTRAVDGTWDRGAYEFAGTALSSLPHPRNVAVN